MAPAAAPLPPPTHQRPPPAVTMCGALCRLLRAGYTILHIGALSTGFTINWNRDGALDAMEQVGWRGWPNGAAQRAG